MEIYLHKQWSNPAMQDKYYLGIIHIKNKMCSIDSLFQREMKRKISDWCISISLHICLLNDDVTVHYLV